jgi:uncharacterized protein (TIGR00299 family) protein
VRVAHFDCFSGISGDMVLGALIDAGVDAEAIRTGIDSLGLPIKLTIERVNRGGVMATHARVDAPHEHAHRHLPQIEKILSAGRLTERQRDLAIRIFRRLGEAEAAVHGIAVEKVHFHEVGALDSVADIAGAAIGLDLLGVERFTSRSVPPGSGMVKCEHGMMPVPAPATALLLRGVPLAETAIKTELTTPTGAAILTTVVTEWTDSPAMTAERIGHGAGTKDFATQPNVLRLLVGTAADAPNPAESDQVWILETNLDDVPAEVVGYTIERLFEAGALDVWSTPIQMKKNRPGVLLSVIADAGAVPALETILFRETGTFGVRRHAAQRHKLRREACTIETPWGPVRGKRGWRDGLSVVTPEYEDFARVAREHGVPLREVYQEAMAHGSPRTSGHG